MRVYTKENKLFLQKQNEVLLIEAWGKDSVRVRSTCYLDFSKNAWALSEEMPDVSDQISIKINDDKSSSFTNGRIRIEANNYGVLSFYRDDDLVLREYYRYYDGTISKESRCLKVVSREFKPYVGGDYKLSVRFESRDDEKLFGMGQYQQPYLDLKGSILELAQRNSQVSIPFLVSSLGYGFLWNNPAVGKATFGTNYTEWIAECSKEIDYFVTVADTPKQILENYTLATGRAPMIPENVLGLWQSKLRYQTQDEVLEVARKYKELNIPLDVIVIDFFHWDRQGDWRFDNKYWPDPKAMCDELHAMGTKVIVSIWPTVDKKSENFQEMMEHGYLIRPERGCMQTYDFQGDCMGIDATNPGAREYIWNKCKKNYYDFGIDMFWLDNAEPDYSFFDFDIYRYAIGCALEVSNIYPFFYTKAFYDGIASEGRSDEMLHLVRSAWAGSQKINTLLWSGDVPSTYESLRDQVSAGLNVGLAGIPWWTTDIGGFMTDDYLAPEFIELLLRWYEFAVFTPFLRMHGDRGPHNIPSLSGLEHGGGSMTTGQPNELWSYGKEAFKVMKANLDLRLSIVPYIEELMKEASINGSPLMRTMFYEFPEDKKCWTLSDQYMFGSKYLVAPILTPNTFERTVFLPCGTWKEIHTNVEYEGNQVITASAPIEYIPVFQKIK